MALNLTPEQIEILKRDAASAEPYDYDSDEMTMLDGDNDFKRWIATCAKIFLEQDEREKASKSIAAEDN